MAKICYICGKKQVAGNQVSHSHIANGRTFGANLQKKPVDIDGKATKKYICTKLFLCIFISQNHTTLKVAF